jgi:uncharacterized protein (DUF433 family)
MFRMMLGEGTTKVREDGSGGRFSGCLRGVSVWYNGDIFCAISTKALRLSAIPPRGRLVNGVTGMKTPIPSGTESWLQRSPGVCGGEACIRNTRHTVSGLVVWRRSGLSDAQLLKHHPDLTQADLTVAWSYYNQRAEEIDQAIKDDEES